MGVPLASNEVQNDSSETQVDANELEDEECSECELQDDENTAMLRAKWSLDGCRTLQEVSDKLRRLAQFYEEKQKDGWELEGPIYDDYGYMRRAIQQ